jgi:hypothetical protein
MMICSLTLLYAIHVDGFWTRTTFFNSKLLQARKTLSLLRL